MSSPYTDRPPRSFWRRGVLDTSPEMVKDLYVKKFDIPKTAKIATFGSCFAQHITRHIRKKGFDVLDTEKAPPKISDVLAQRYGYRTYSARYGNIYVVRQLLQLFDEAFGNVTLNAAPWEKDGKFFDPFRPGVEPEGLDTPEEVREHRAAHLAAVRRLFRSTDLVIFTLGLTETWMHKDTKCVYPTAPGTIAGTFDPDIHVFKNFTCAEIAADLRQLRGRLRQINPQIKMLLTVSPVPLTATATDQHVLVASSHSKSVLRAVAGEMSDQFADVDYFPSYELITSHWSQGRFFQDNLRDVKEAGIAAALRSFCLQHDPVQSKPAPELAQMLNDDFSLPSPAQPAFCEDQLLEAFSK